MTVKEITKRMLIKIAIWGFLIYFGIGLLATVMQRRIIYHPWSIEKSSPFPMYTENMQEVFIECEDGVTINGLFATGDQSNPAILMLHGNAGNIKHRSDLFADFHARGHTVLIIDYHGYGKSDGSPSEENLYMDAEAALTWLGSEHSIRKEDVVIFAKSIGTGVGTEMAVRHTVKGLILESPLVSTAAVAGSHFPYCLYPTGLLTIDKFDNVSKIDSITCPLLLIYAADDKIIPPEQSITLFEKAPEPKKVHRVENAGHNNTGYIEPEQYWNTITDWIKELNERAK